MGRGKAGESGGFAAALSCSVYVETQVIPNVTKCSEESRLSRTQVICKYYLLYFKNLLPWFKRIQNIKIVKIIKHFEHNSRPGV